MYYGRTMARRVGGGALVGSARSLCPAPLPGTGVPVWAEGGVICLPRGVTNVGRQCQGRGYPVAMPAGPSLPRRPPTVSSLPLLSPRYLPATFAYAGPELEEKKTKPKNENNV